MPIPDHCLGCPYREFGPAIGPRGDTASRIVLVGEAPGAKEVIEGRPFVGPAGDVLWKALAEVGLSEAEVFITNSVACRPYDPVKPKVRAPKPGAIDACRGRLVHEIEAHPRAVIVALGGTAVRALTGQRGFRVLKDRGRMLASPWGPVVPTLHPARVLRRPAEAPLLVDDLMHARRFGAVPQG
jgi:DNA polymerase